MMADLEESGKILTKIYHDGYNISDQSLIIRTTRFGVASRIRLTQPLCYPSLILECKFNYRMGTYRHVSSSIAVETESNLYPGHVLI